MLVSLAGASYAEDYTRVHCLFWHGLYTQMPFQTPNTVKCGLDAPALVESPNKLPDKNLLRVGRGTLEGVKLYQRLEWDKRIETGAML